MPSQNNSSLAGFNKAISASGDNRVGAVAKAAGTASTQFHQIPVQRSSAFTGDSNDDITKMDALGSTPVGLSIARPISGNALGDADEFRKLVEVTLPDPITTRGVHYKLGDSERMVGSGIAAGGPWKERLDGIWMNSSGAVGIPLGSGFTYTNILAGSGDTTVRGRGYGQAYFYRIGLTQVTKRLSPRTQ